MPSAPKNSTSLTKIFLGELIRPDGSTAPTLRGWGLSEIFFSPTGYLSSTQRILLKTLKISTSRFFCGKTIFGTWRCPLFPPSPRDVYRRVALTVCGRRQRRMMMRHWNILDPGDHDFGVDDFKGSEQHALRHIDALPQDSEYVRHTFAAIWHIVITDEKDWSRGAPARHKRWRMPQGDLSIVITDARLWRTTQYTEIWPVAYDDRTGREIPQWGVAGIIGLGSHESNSFRTR